MKVDINEYNDTFWINFEPETIKEACQLTRIKLNATKEIKAIYTCFYRLDNISSSIILSKRKQTKSSI